MLADKHVNQAAQHSCGIVDARIGCLTEEVRRDARAFLQLVDDAAEEHGLALTRVTLNPQQRVFLVPPLLVFVVIQNPLVYVDQQTPFVPLNPCLIMSGVGRP